MSDLPSETLPIMHIAFIVYQNVFDSNGVCSKFSSRGETQVAMKLDDVVISCAAKSFAACISDLCAGIWLHKGTITGIISYR